MMASSSWQMLKVNVESVQTPVSCPCGMIITQDDQEMEFMFSGIIDELKLGGTNKNTDLYMTISVSSATASYVYDYHP